MTTKLLSTHDAVFIYQTSTDEWGDKETELVGALRIKPNRKGSFTLFSLSSYKGVPKKYALGALMEHKVTQKDYKTFKAARAAMDLQVFAYAV